MINSINGLQNMEMMLYGGSTAFNGAPSMYNNYCAQPTFAQNNPYYNNGVGGYPQNYAYYGYQNPQVAQFEQAAQQQKYLQQANQLQQAQTNQLPQTYANWNTQSAPQQQATTFNGLSQAETKAITDFYAKNLEPSESFKNAGIMGGVSCAIMNNPRMIVHPWNYITTSLPNSKVNQLFKGVRQNGTALNAAWKENNLIMEELFSQLHRAEARSKKRPLGGLFRKQYTPAEFNEILKIAKDALTPDATGKIDINKAAEAAEKLRYGYTNNGRIAGFWGRLRGKNLDFISKINETGADKAIKDAADNLVKFGGKNMKLPQAFKRAGGWFAVGMGALEILMNWTKVQTAQAKDAENAEKGIVTNYGKKQKTQTISKGIANSVGWAVGESLGILAYAKLGATVGTTLGPGIGTFIGAGIGLVCGSVGMWLAGKATKAIVGEDVSNKIEAENMTQTAEGQTELLRTAMQAAQKGQPMDATTQAALQKAMQYEMQKAQQQQIMQQQVAYPQQLSYMA